MAREMAADLVQGRRGCIVVHHMLCHSKSQICLFSPFCEKKGHVLFWVRTKTREITFSFENTGYINDKEQLIIQIDGIKKTLDSLEEIQLEERENHIMVAWWVKISYNSYRMSIVSECAVGTTILNETRLWNELKYSLYMGENLKQKSFMQKVEANFGL